MELIEDIDSTLEELEKQFGKEKPKDFPGLTLEELDSCLRNRERILNEHKPESEINVQMEEMLEALIALQKAEDKEE